MALTEQTKIARIEIDLLGSGDIFIQTQNLILKDDEIISTSNHRDVVNIADEVKLEQITGAGGLAAKLAEITALFE